MPNYESGQSAAIVVNGRDESRLNNKANLQDGREILDTTTFQTQMSAKTFSYGQGSGAAGFDGFSHLDNATLREQMATTLGKNRDVHRILIGPHGLQVGLEALFFEALQTQFDTDLSLSGVPSVQMQFATSRFLIRDGVCLHALNGTEGVGGNEVAQIAFSATPVQQFLSIGATGTAPRFEFRLSDYGSDAALKTALKAGIEGLAAYSGRTVTITGTLAGTTTKTGTLRIEFDGALNVPALEAKQGPFHELVLIGATSVKTVYGTVGVDPASATSAGVQLDVRSKAGEFVGCVVTKTGTGGNSTFLFAFPVGAAPTNLVQPTTNRPEIQTLAGNVSSVALDAKGGTAQTLNAGESLGALQTKIAAVYGVPDGEVVVGGTSTAPVSGVDLSLGSQAVAQENPSQAFDGDLATTFMLHGGGFQTFALATPTVVAKIRLNAPSDQRFRFFGCVTESSDGSTWVELASQNFNTVEGWQEIVVNNSTQFNYIVVLDGLNSGETRVSLRELQVNPTPSQFNLTATFSGASVAGQNVAPMTTATAGVTINTIQQGGVVPDPQVAVSNTPGGAATSALPSVLQNGGMSEEPVYNVTTQSGADDWVDGGAASASGFVLRSHALALASGASVQVIFEHTDGTTAPNLAGVSALGSHTHSEVGAKETVDETATVKRWTRTRNVLTGANALFAAALARE